MAKIVKELALLLAFLMLMTSCYTYQQATVSQTYNLKEKDRVTISDDRINYKYERFKVKAITNSSVILKKGLLQVEINLDNIEYLEIGVKDKTTTTILIIAIPVIVISVTSWLIYMMLGGGS
jgi:hypothetical protein